MGIIDRDVIDAADGERLGAGERDQGVGGETGHIDVGIVADSDEVAASVDEDFVEHVGRGAARVEEYDLAYLGRIGARGLGGSAAIIDHAAEDIARGLLVDSRHKRVGRITGTGNGDRSRGRIRGGREASPLRYQVIEGCEDGRPGERDRLPIYGLAGADLVTGAIDRDGVIIAGVEGVDEADDDDLSRARAGGLVRPDADLRDAAAVLRMPRDEGARTAHEMVDGFRTIDHEREVDLELEEVVVVDHGRIGDDDRSVGERAVDVDDVGEKIDDGVANAAVRVRHFVNGARGVERDVAVEFLHPAIRGRFDVVDVHVARGPELDVVAVGFVWPVAIGPNIVNVEIVAGADGDGAVAGLDTGKDQVVGFVDDEIARLRGPMRARGAGLGADDVLDEGVDADSSAGDDVEVLADEDRAAVTGDAGGADLDIALGIIERTGGGGDNRANGGQRAPGRQADIFSGGVARDAADKSGQRKVRDDLDGDILRGAELEVSNRQGRGLDHNVAGRFFNESRVGLAGENASNLNRIRAASDDGEEVEEAVARDDAAGDADVGVRDEFDPLCGCERARDGNRLRGVDDDRLRREVRRQQAGDLAHAVGDGFGFELEGFAGAIIDQVGSVEEAIERQRARGIKRDTGGVAEAVVKRITGVVVVVRRANDLEVSGGADEADGVALDDGAGEDLEVVMRLDEDGRAGIQSRFNSADRQALVDFAGAVGLINRDVAGRGLKNVDRANGHLETGDAGAGGEVDDGGNDVDVVIDRRLRDSTLGAQDDLTVGRDAVERLPDAGGHGLTGEVEFSDEDVPCPAGTCRIDRDDVGCPRVCPGVMDTVFVEDDIDDLDRAVGGDGERSVGDEDLLEGELGAAALGEGDVTGGESLDGDCINAGAEREAGGDGDRELVAAEEAEELRNDAFDVERDVAAAAGDDADDGQVGGGGAALGVNRGINGEADVVALRGAGGLDVGGDDIAARLKDDGAVEGLHVRQRDSARERERDIAGVGELDVDRVDGGVGDEVVAGNARGDEPAFGTAIEVIGDQRAAIDYDDAGRSGDRDLIVGDDLRAGEADIATELTAGE